VQDELTLKEFILVIQEYFVYFLQKWYWVVLGALVVGGIFFYNAYTTPVNYDASLTFMMNNEKAPSIGAGAILGSLGLGGGGEGGDKAGKLQELAKSRKVLGKVLFDSALIDGKTQLVADHIIDIYDYDEDWEENEELKGFRFGEGMPLKNDFVGNSVFKMLYSKLIDEEEGLISLTVDELSGLSDLRAISLNPELSVVLVNQVFKELSEYFVATSISGKQETLTQLSERADSVKIELGIAESRLARFEDRSSQILLRQNTVKGQELNRQVFILSSMYGEIVKNKETAAFLLANEKPAFNLIDEPLSPLRPTKESWTKALIIGGSLGGVLAAIILFFVKLIQDALRTV
jgi:uncharacterized protein involved in exopolysaccharide biosynthesis